MAGEAVTLCPMFGTMFGDHAVDCACDACTAFQASCREQIGKLGDVRAALDGLAASARYTRNGVDITEEVRAAAAREQDEDEMRNEEG